MCEDHHVRRSAKTSPSLDDGTTYPDEHSIATISSVSSPLAIDVGDQYLARSNPVCEGTDTHHDIHRTESSLFPPAAEQSVARTFFDIGNSPVSYPHDETHPYPEPHSRQTLVEAGDRSEAISLFSSAGFLHTEDTSRPSERTCAEYQPSITPTNLDKTNFQLCAQRSAMWNPFWLQKSWLVAYASVFGALLTAVVALHLTSLHKNGLVSTGGTTVMIYVWRFLPTAVLVALLSLWNPVDYFTRLLQPWNNLSKGPTSASRSLLVDYVSALQPVTLAAALKNAEWPVVLAMGVTLALTATKVVSTGLLSVIPTSITVTDVKLVQTAFLDVSAWNSSNTDYDPLQIYSGVRGGVLKRPAWQGDNFVAEPFTYAEDYTMLTNATYSTKTRAVFTSLFCEAATILWDDFCHSADEECFATGRVNASITSASCKAQITLSLAHKDGKYNLDTSNATYSGDAKLVHCANRSALFVSVALTDENLAILNYSAMVCDPSFEARDLVVQVERGDQQHFSEPSATLREDTSLQHLDASTLLTYILNGSDAINLPWSKPIGEISEYKVPFLVLASLPYNVGNPGSPTLKPLLDPDVFNTSISETFAGAASMIIALQMFSPQNTTIFGSLRYQESRLHATKMPTITIVVILSLCLLSTVILMWISPANVVPHNPNSIAGIAAILSSVRHTDMFRHKSFEDLSTHLRKHEFSSKSRANGFDIVAHLLNPDEDEQDNRRKSGNNVTIAKRWVPLTLQSWVKVSAIVLCLTVIIILEVLQQISNRSEGFLKMPSDGSGLFWITVVPAAALTGISLLYSSIHFNVGLISPYYILDQPGAKAKHTLATNYLGSTPLFTIWPALQRQHYASVVTAFAAVIGAALTIVVSGLYSVSYSEVDFATELVVTNGWNTTWIYTICEDCVFSKDLAQDFESADASAAEMLNWVMWGNASDPQGTFDDLVFPNLSTLNQTKDSTRQQQKLEIVLPARRAVLDCTATLTSELKTRTDGSSFFSGKLHSPCDFDPSDGYSNESELTIEMPNGRDFDLETYRGAFAELNYASKPEVYSLAEYFGDPNPGRDDCPSVAFAFGYFVRSNATNPHDASDRNYTSLVQNITSTSSEVTTLACVQKMQEVDTTFTLIPSDLSIHPSYPPVPHENTVRWVPGSHWYPVIRNFQRLKVTTSNTTFNTEVGSMDRFFAPILFGKHAIPPSELTGTANIPRLQSAVSNMYGRYMAQVMSRKFRVPFNSNTTPQRVHATITERVPRLVQHSAPKIALQVLLGVMMICGIVGWMVLPKARILPHDPCSVAGTACLLAGDEFWGPGKKNWEDDQVFRLETRDGRFGVYAVGAESQRLVD